MNAKNKLNNINHNNFTRAEANEFLAQTNNPKLIKIFRHHRNKQIRRYAEYKLMDLLGAEDNDWKES